MFNNKKNTQPLIDVTPGNKADTTIIGASSSFDGKLDSTGIIRVDGIFSGILNAEGSIIVGESGNIKGNIKARKVTIAGKVEGNIHCAGSLELTSNGKLYGDIEVKSISIEDGAVFQGKCMMIDDSTPALGSGADIKLISDNSTEVSE